MDRRMLTVAESETKLRRNGETKKKAERAAVCAKQK
jgi:hypothetical protein